MLLYPCPTKSRHSGLVAWPQLTSFIFYHGMTSTDKKWKTLTLLPRILTLVISLCEIAAVGMPVYVLNAATFFLTLSTVAPLGANGCNILVHVISALGTSTTCLGSSLFLIRARSVWSESERAKWVFNILWFLAIAGGISTAPFSFYGTSVEPSGLCVVPKLKQIEAVASLSVAVFDTVVYVAISYRVIYYHERAPSRWAQIVAFFRGSETGPMARALLQTGQLYFL